MVTKYEFTACRCGGTEDSSSRSPLPHISVAASSAAAEYHHEGYLGVEHPCLTRFMNGSTSRHTGNVRSNPQEAFFGRGEGGRTKMMCLVYYARGCLCMR